MGNVVVLAPSLKSNQSKSQLLGTFCLQRLKSSDNLSIQSPKFSKICFSLLTRLPSNLQPLDPKLCVDDECKFYKTNEWPQSCYRNNRKLFSTVIAAFRRSGFHLGFTGKCKSISNRYKLGRPPFPPVPRSISNLGHFLDTAFCETLCLLGKMQN